MKISIKSKLVGGFTLILIMMLIVGWRGIAAMSDIKDALNSIYTEEVIPAKMAANANVAIIAFNRAILNQVSVTELQEMDMFEEIILQQKAIALERFHSLAAMEHLSPRGRELLQKLKVSFNMSELLQDHIVSLSRTGQQERARQFIREKLRPVVDKMDGLMSEFIQLQEKQMNKTLKITDGRYQQGFKGIAVIIAAAFSLSLFIAFYLSRMILKNVNEMVRGAKSVAMGKFKQGKVTIPSKDEFGYLGSIFNQMLDSLEQNIIERNKEREKFISVLIHDLKGPLMPLVGFTKRLIEGKAKSEEDQLEMLKSIEDSTQELSQVIENTSQSLKNKVSLKESFNPKQVEFSSILREVVNKFTLETDKRGMEILINNRRKQQWDNLDKINLQTDPHQLETLLENLIGNAIKYAERTVKIESNKRNGVIHFAVSDDGPGIPKKYHEKIFDEYFQAPKSKKGTGIGLYSVKKVVENHKGKIVVHSSVVNRGTSFVVTLPVNNL